MEQEATKQELLRRYIEREAAPPSNRNFWRELLDDLMLIQRGDAYDQNPDIKAARRNRIRLDDMFQDKVTSGTLEMVLFEKREVEKVEEAMLWLTERLDDGTFQRDLDSDSDAMDVVVAGVRAAADGVNVTLHKELPPRAQSWAARQTGTKGPFACLTD